LALIAPPVGVNSLVIDVRILHIDQRDAVAVGEFKLQTSSTGCRSAIGPMTSHCRPPYN
jgi:hypothetical protein